MTNPFDFTTELFNDLKASQIVDRQRIDDAKDVSFKALSAFNLEIYTFANRPLASEGMVVQTVATISDGLDVGETTTNGTGVLCMYKPTLDDWYRVADNTVVTT